MKHLNHKSLAAVVVIILIVAAISASRFYQTRAATPVPEITLTDLEQKPILEIVEQQRQSNVAFNNQMYGAARAIASTKGVVIGTAVGEYSVSQQPDGRVKFVQNTAPQPAQ